MKRLAGLLFLIFITTAATAEEAPKLKASQYWLHVMVNISSDTGLADLLKLMERASKAGYNGLVVNDVKFIKYQLRPASFDANFKKFRQACTDLKLAFIPCVTPMGYCETFLTHDPNLAEGMPVRDAVFIVKDGKLVPIEESCKVENGSFETFKDNRPASWEITDPGKVAFIDDSVHADGKVAVRMQDAHGAERVTQKIKLIPWHYYHVSAMVKTEDCQSKEFRLQAYDGKLVLDWQPPVIKKTMDWTRVDASFNSLDNTEALLGIGSWDGKAGKIWWDDVKLEPAGFVNILRRDSLPLKITSEDGKTIYVEGKDFSEVKDAKLLNDPKPGYYTIWHDAPVVTIPAGSQLKEGQKVLASYHHALPTGKTGQITCCMSEPKVGQLIEEEIRWLKENCSPDAYFMSHDEIRHQGWDDSCVKQNKTPGQILADNVKQCSSIIERVDPGKSIVVWNDMFDPHHNARKTGEHGEKFAMYLARGDGPWAGSWEGLPKEVGVVNWNCGSAESCKFFGEHGNQQIFSHVAPDKIVKILNDSGANPGTAGVMYTTWDGNFNDLEKYIDAVKKWEADSGGFKANLTASAK
jgi:hypothetical protein